MLLRKKIRHTIPNPVAVQLDVVVGLPLIFFSIAPLSAVSVATSTVCKTVRPFFLTAG